MRSILGSYGKGINHQLPQIITILSGSLAGVSNGLLMAWTSPSIPEILANNSIGISFEEASYFTVIPPISMALTAPVFSVLVDIIGRKTRVLLVAVPFLIAWILIAVSKNLWIFYFSRVVTGVGDAMLFASSPIYVCEIAEPSVRGTWGNVVVTSMYSGIFFINVIGSYNNIFETALICGCLPIIHVVLFCFMPETPYFLLMRGREKDALESLKMLRWRADVDKELSEIKAYIKRQTLEKGTLKDLFTITSNRRALIMCLGIRVAQQFSGLPAFEVYTQYVFKEAGGSVSDKASAMIFSGTLTLMVALSSYLVERYGRRPLIMWSCLGCGLTLVVETIYFSLQQFSDVDLSNFGWLPLTGMLVYIVICATGIGILPTLILGEIFAESIKSKATAVMNVVLAVCLLSVPKLFQFLTYNFGIYSPFCCFSACCFAGVFFSYFFVVETKGKTLEEIQQVLKRNK